MCSILSADHKGCISPFSWIDVDWKEMSNRKTDYDKKFVQVFRDRLPSMLWPYQWEARYLPEEKMLPFASTLEEFAVKSLAEVFGEHAKFRRWAVEKCYRLQYLLQVDPDKRDIVCMSCLITISRFNLQLPFTM